MSQQKSANLSLPYIQPSQAQKHVTHNEAIRILDALVQAVVEEPPRNSPPASASEGTCYLIGSAPAGAWAGHANDIAWRTDGTWSFLQPQPGWAVRVISDGSTRAWLNGEWQVDNLPEVVSQVGVNTSANSGNRLAVSSPATLLTHEGAGHQVKVNKSVAGDTASLLFQTDFSGRAEIGTAGSDSFSIKVSADGTVWHTALEVTPSAGAVSFPNGAAVATRIDLSGRWSCEANQWSGMNASFGASGGSHSQAAGTGSEPEVDYTFTGPLVPGGATLTEIEGAFRRGDAEITAADIRVTFQNGAWDGTWDSDAETASTVLFAADNITLSDAWTRVTGSLGGWVAPDDGFLLVFVRPVGALSATRFIYSSIRIGYLTAA
jgi:hypothetical protein